MSTTAFRPVLLHSSLRSDAQSLRRRQSLVSGAIDHAFHYGGIRQTQLWLEVHRRHAPLFTDLAFEGIYREIFARLAEELSGHAIHIIGLGVGGGQKESWLLEALHRAGCRLRYTPVDASPELAFLSVEAAAPWVHAASSPIVGHLALLENLPEWLDQDPPDELRLFTAIGFVHNFLPSELLPWLSHCLRAADRMVLSANLAPIAAGTTATDADCLAACQDVLPQYDNPETRAWLRQILLDWNIAAHLSEPHFAIETLEGVQGFVARSTWIADTEMEWEGQRFSSKAGDTLRLFFSLRFTPDRLAACLSRHGMRLEHGAVTPCGQEGVWLASR